MDQNETVRKVSIIVNGQKIYLLLNWKENRIRSILAIKYKKTGPPVTNWYDFTNRERNASSGFHQPQSNLTTQGDHEQLTKLLQTSNNSLPEDGEQSKKNLSRNCATVTGPE